jgi:hypothetical protein
VILPVIAGTAGIAVVLTDIPREVRGLPGGPGINGRTLYKGRKRNFRGLKISAIRLEDVNFIQRLFLFKIGFRNFIKLFSHFIL